MEVDNTVINPLPIKGKDNKVLLTSTQAWFWPFDWENLEDYTEHYKVEQELVDLGVKSNEFIAGWQSKDGIVKLYDWREHPPEWMEEIVDRTFHNNEPIFFNDSSYRSFDYFT